jgi:hypothetical protein
VNKESLNTWIGELNLSSAAFLLFSPISILAFPVSLLVVNKDSSAFSLTLYGILLTAITYPIYLTFQTLFNYLNLGDRASKGVLLLLGISAVGIFRGYVFFQLVEYLKLEQPSPFSERIINSSITTLFWLLLANTVINISRSFKLKYDRALNRLLSLEFKPKADQDFNTDNLTSIQSKLKKSVEKYLDQKDLSSAQSLANSIKGQINDEIRPLSQRIWIDKLDEFPVVDRKLLLSDSVSKLDYSLTTYLLSLISLSLLNNFFLRGVTESLLRTVSTLVIVILMILLKSRLNVAAKSTLTTNTAFLVALGLVPILISESFLALLGYSPHWIASLLISPIPPVLLIVLSVLKLSANDRKLIINTLRNYSHSADSNKKDLAAYLHNTLQSELLALSSQLEEVAVAGDKERLPIVLERVSALINRSLVDDFAKYSESPLMRIESLIKAWAGIMEITVEIPAEYLNDPQRNVILARTIEEVATNAFRKGKAKAVRVTAIETASGLELCFSTNGTALINEDQGLGSKWFDSVSVKPWQIKEKPEGIEFTIVI